MARADEVAPAPESVVIRVLLMEADGRVRARDWRAGGGGAVVEPGPRGLLADRRAVGDVWRLAGSGVVAVNQMRFRGELEFRRISNGMQVINEVALEDYVAGILGREIYPDWHPEMLKAQAVVARSYALHQRAESGGRAFHVEAGTGSQVYGGLAAETPAIRAAVSATRGEFLAYARKPILAVYHSASGGRTASSEEVWGRPLPYLVSLEVADEQDSSRIRRMPTGGRPSQRPNWGALSTRSGSGSGRPGSWRSSIALGVGGRCGCGSAATRETTTWRRARCARRSENR